ncbi:T9SS type A sorting domain-containing protein [uncultured Algibacter sp.]|uniref:T9SS type A sorting domain-containing protein n=1 Tax=uncultured Algibacter sp. TaxID=298659 RepID=UPI002633F30A|nr:T9SS type A sorting domain-containing protein [uncultured Algibacter sp.]
MKTKLLLVLLITSLGYSQIPIEQYDSVTETQYVGVSSSIILDQENIAEPGGLYEINTLTRSSTINTTDTHTSPSSGVSVFNADREEGVTVFTTNQSEGHVEYTKIEDNIGIVLTYSDAAEVGTFPWGYDLSNSSNNRNSDSSAGTFVYSDSGIPTDINGTFDGTIASEVDWYGTLKINDVLTGNVSSAFDGEVTRLKVVQQLDLDAGLIGSGDAVLTYYFYYDANSANIVFRTISVEGSFTPIIGAPITLSDFIMESIETSTLSTLETSGYKLDISIYPNPVGSHLNLKFGKDFQVNSISVSDLSGREVLRTHNVLEKLMVGQLDAGIYLVSILTNKGVWTEKIIKK